jgi:hypothetical protein
VLSKGLEMDVYIALVRNSFFKTLRCKVTTDFLARLLYKD